MDDLAASFNKAYTANVRPSFFGGVVSTRLQSQNLNKVLPQNADRLELLKQRKESRGSAGPSNPKPSQSTRKLTPAEQKAHKQRQLEEKRRRMQARVVAEMQADVGDKFVPEVHGAAAVKKPKAEIGAGGAQTAKKPKLDSRLPSTASGHNLKQSPGTSIKRAPQGFPPKPVEKRLASGQKVMIHTSVPKPRKLGTPKPAQQRPTGSKKPVPPKPSRPAFPSKQCRSCREDKPLTDYYADKRLPDGANHMCSACARKKGLSGRLLTREEVLVMFPSATKASNGASHSGSTAAAGAAHPVKSPQPSAACAPSYSQSKTLLSGQRTPSGNAKFYGNSRPRGLPPGAGGGRHGSGRGAYSQLDEYEEDFVVDDIDEDDWRKELSQVTRGYFRERHDDDLGNDRMMEASAADMRREEARSKRIGRLEDAEAQREEEERLAAKLKRAQKKKPRKKKKRKTGVSAFLADEASESDSEEDDEYD